MVEFGLKLEDNKVNKWSDQYLDYDKLKALLKKTQNAYKARNVLREKYADVLEKEGMLVSSWDESGSGDEKQSLLDKSGSSSMNDYGSPTKYEVAAVSSSSDSVKRTVSEVSLVLMNVFGSNKTAPNKDYIKSRYKDLCNTLDLRHLEFAQFLRSEIAKVDTFYLDQVADIKKRFEFLDNSVAEAARILTYNERQTNDVQDVGKVHMQHFRSGTNSLNASEREALHKSWATRSKKRGGRRKKVGKMLGLVDAASESDDDNDEHEVKLKYQSDSIKRSIVDLYRNAKLLRNYASLNYTGFVK